MPELRSFTEDINQKIPKTVIGYKISSSSCTRRRYFYFISAVPCIGMSWTWTIYKESHGAHIIKFIMLNRRCLFGESFVLPFFARVVFSIAKDSPNLDNRYNEWTLSLNRYNIGFDLMYALWIIICANDSHIHSTLQSQQKINGEQYVSYLCL